jgi:hypothetical protein
MRDLSLIVQIYNLNYHLSQQYIIEVAFFTN